MVALRKRVASRLDIPMARLCPPRSDPMKRRQFLTLAAGTAAVAGCNRTARDAAAPAEKKPVAMYVGCQRSPTTAEMLQFFKRHGVDHICGYPVIANKERGHWTEPELARTRELCETNGVKLDMVALPFLKSSHIDREKRGAIMLGQDPQRQRDVEDLQKCVEACAKVGVPAVKYNLSLLGVVRTERTPGRGGSTYSTWKLAK